MADKPTVNLISKLVMGGVTHTIQDAWAWGEIDEIKQAIAGGVTIGGVLASGSIADGDAVKELTVKDGAGTKTIAASDQKDGMMFFYNNGNNTLEFIVIGGKYSEYGSTGALRALAFADTASGNVDVPTSAAVNAFIPTLANTLGVTTSAATLGVSTTAATASGSFTPADTVVADADVTLTPTTDTGALVTDITYDAASTTLTLTTSAAAAYWKDATGKAQGQTITYEAQPISVSYDKATGVTGEALASAALEGSISVNEVTGVTVALTTTSTKVTVSPDA